MQALSQLIDSIFSLMGGAKQLPLYVLLAPIPILLWLFWAELRTAVGRASGDPAIEQVLHVVDGFNSAIGKTYGWCIVVLTFTTSYEVFARYVFKAPTE